VTQFLWIPGPLPSLNDIIDARRRIFRVKGKPAGDAYTKLKAAWTTRIRLRALAQRFRPVQFGAFSYLCVERDRKRDPSNVVAGAVKLIEDALQAAELLPNDGWAQVTAIAPFWDVGDPAGVLVAVGEVALSKAALVQRWEMGRAA
jgi:hypothetical protein